MRRAVLAPGGFCGSCGMVVTTGVLQSRGIYSIWGMITLEEGMSGNKTWLQRITSPSSYRSFNMRHFPEANAPVPLSKSETYLLSAVEDDLERLMAVDWTFDFDPFWRDRVKEHAALFDILYGPGRSLYKFVFGNASGNPEGRLVIERKLNQLKAALHWAEETERRFSAIANARFHMQRDVFDAFEREKILVGCVDLVEEFKQKVPTDFYRKAVGELDNHVGNMRSWIWDCPNAKRTFPRRLA